MLGTFLGALTLAGLALQGEPAPRPSIVLVTADTLRREHLSCYGYPRPTSPHIDALASESVVFEHAYAPMAITFPSHLSMLTGLYPHQHGHISNQGAVRAPYETAPGRATLATALAAAGYAAGGFVSSSVLNERTGIGAGFQTYDCPTPKRPQRAALETVERALAWLEKVPADEPFFLWIHLWDTHDPNEPAPEYLAQMAPDETLRAWVRGRGFEPAALHAKFSTNVSIGKRFFQLLDRPSPGSRKERRPLNLRPGAPLFTIDEPALLDLYARYDACVRQIDDQVARVLEALAARGAEDDTAFVFCADHGQALGENAYFGHATDMQINVAVPLLLRFPARCKVPPQRNPRLVSLVDLMPTVLAHLSIPGLEAYVSQFRGTDVLAPDLAREHVVTAEESTRWKQQPYHAGLVTERWKYVPVEGGPARLYDLAGAGEARDVAAQNPEVAKELEALLAAELATSVLKAGESAPIDAEQQELLKRLEELGYGGERDDE